MVHQLHRLEDVALYLYNFTPIFVLYNHLGSSTLTAECDSKEEVRAVKPEDSPIPAHSSVIIDGEEFLSSLLFEPSW